MEQERKELTLSLQLPDQTHLKCPRCSSTNTKFRYYNNHSISQPRHYCKSCKRLWTVGGKLRDIPIGGGSYNRPNRQLAPLPLADPLENADSQQLMAEIVPQNSGLTGIQPISNSTESQPPFTSFHVNDEISCPVESLIQPDIIVGPAVNPGIQLGSRSADMAFMLDWDIKPIGQPVNTGNQYAGGADDMAFHIKPELMVSDQPLPQGYIGQANNYASSYQGPDYNLVQPTFDMNLLPQDSSNDFFLSNPNGCLWMKGNSGGNTTDAGMPSTSANPNQWPKFPGYGSQ